MYFKFLTFIAFFIFIWSPNINADSSEPSIEQKVTVGQIFVITDNFSLGRNLSGKGQVFYLAAGDAYRNYRAQIDQNWSFAAVDSRNLYRVIKDDSVKIISKKFNDKIIEVELLTGPDKGRKYFAINEELQKNFIKKDQNETS